MMDTLSLSGLQADCQNNPSQSVAFRKSEGVGEIMRIIRLLHDVITSLVQMLVKPHIIFMEKFHCNGETEVTFKRMENAMEIVARHIARHVREQGHSPFAVIFERLEQEREKILDGHKTYDRAASFLSQKATFDSH